MSSLNKQITKRLSTVQIILAIIMGSMSFMGLLLIMAVQAPGVQAAPSFRPLAATITGTTAITHTSNTTHQMSVYANGRISDHFLTDDGSIDGHNQIDQNGKDPLGTTVAVLFNQHPITRMVDVGAQGDFTAITPIVLNTESTIPGYSEDTQVTYASQVLPYQITQRTLATTTNNCVIMELDVQNTGSQTLTGGRLLYMVDVDVAHFENSDQGFYNAAQRLVYFTDDNDGGGTNLPGFAMGISLLKGDLAGYGINGEPTFTYSVNTSNKRSYPTLDEDIIDEMVNPRNSNTYGSNGVLWLVANIPDLSQSQTKKLAFSLCAQNALTEDEAEDGLLELYDFLAVKAATPAAGSSVTFGDLITYTVTLTNGSSFAVDDIVVTDTIPASTDLIDYSVTQGSIVAVDETVVATIGSMSPGAEPITVTIVVRPSASSTGGTIIANQAFVDSGLFITGTNIVTHEFVAQVLSVNKGASPEPVEAGERLTYTIIIANDGKLDATGVAISDSLPANTSFTPGSVEITPASAGGVVGSPPAIVQGLTVKAKSQVTITYQVDVKSPLPNGLILTNTVSITSPQIFEEPTATVTSTVKGVPRPELTKSSSHDNPLLPGDLITYTIVAGNIGNTNLMNVVISDTLPDNTNFIDGSIRLEPAGAGTAGTTPPILASGVEIAVGEQVTVTYVVAVAEPVTAGAVITNTVAITGSEIFIVETKTITDRVTGADLSVTKTSIPVPALPDEPIIYTIIVRNIGSTHVVDATVSDVIPADITDVSWQCVGTSGTVCTASGNGDINDSVTMPTGGVITYTVNGILEASATATLVNTVTVTVPEGVVDLTPENNTAVDINSPKLLPVLSINKTSQPDPVAPGQTLTYTVVVINNGAGDATDAVIRDSVPVGTSLVDGSVSIDPPGAGTIGSPPFLVTGLAITAGERVTLTFAVILANPWFLEAVVTNTASVTSPQVTIEKADTVTNTVLITPSIHIDKTGPATARIGETVVFTFTVTNIGNTLLHDVTVEDTIIGMPAFVGGDGENDGILDVTETWVYTAAYTILPSDASPLINVGTVTATDITDVQTVVASDTHTTLIEFRPILTITKQGPSTANVGSQVVYTFTVKHGAGSDGSPISDVTVEDDKAGTATLISGDDVEFGLLEVDEIWIFTASYTPLVTDESPLTNTGLVQGKDQNGNVITATASHTMTLKKFTPILGLTKEGPATAKISDTVTFTFTVSHAPGSDGSLLNILRVRDNKADVAILSSGDVNMNGSLEISESWVYTASYVIKPSDPSPLANTGVVTGVDQEGDVITATARHTTVITGFKPVLFVSKDGPAAANVDQTVIFTITVVNVIPDVTKLSAFDLQLDESDLIALASLQPGDGSAVTVTQVIDSVAGEATFVSGDVGKIGLLDGGEAWIYTASHTIDADTPDPLVNTATVSGLTRDNRVISATAKHTTMIGPFGSPSGVLYLPLILK